MGSGLLAKFPCSTRKWISLVKENSDSDARCDDIKPLVSKANWNEENPVCLKGSYMDSGPSGATSSWEVKIWPSDVSSCGEEETRHTGISPCLAEETMPSGITPRWEEETGLAGITPCLEEVAEPSGVVLEETGPSGITPSWEDETRSSDITPCWKEQPRTFDITPRWRDWEETTEQAGITPYWEKEVGPSGLTPCWNEAKQISESQSKEEAIETAQEFVYCNLKQLTFERETLNRKEHAEDVFVPCETDNTNSEDEHSPPAAPSATDKYESVSIYSSENQSVADQVLEGVKPISMDKNRKNVMLEKKLADSGTLLQQLRDRVMLLESHLQVPSTAGVQEWNDSCSNEPLTTSFDEPCFGVAKLLLIMGGYDGVTWLPTLDCYSPSTDIVRSLKPMRSVRSYASAAVLNGIIYNFGGWNGYGNPWCDTVECYNPSSNEWMSYPPLSRKKGCLSGASLNNKIYAVGGGNGTDCFKEVEMFDPALGRWIPTQSMLQKRFASALAELDGVLYVVGGYDGKGYLKSAERFDPREVSWSKLQSMNSSRGCHALTAFKGKLYALGGYDGNKYVSSIEVFDPCMGSWLEGDEMKHSRGYFAAPVIGERIYAIGGQTEVNSIVDTVETYRLGHGWSLTKLKGIGKRCFFSAVLH